jgi:hypothetical protein
MRLLFTLLLLHSAAYADESAIHNGGSGAGQATVSCEEQLTEQKGKAERYAAKLQKTKVACMAQCGVHPASWLKPMEWEVISAAGENAATAHQSLNQACKKMAMRKTGREKYTLQVAGDRYSNSNPAADVICGPLQGE